MLSWLSVGQCAGGGGPAWIEAIAETMGQSRDTLEDMVEPFLLQRGFVTRTRQGRCATHRAYEHLVLLPPAEEPNDSALDVFFSCNVRAG